MTNQSGRIQTVRGLIEPGDLAEEVRSEIRAGVGGTSGKGGGSGEIGCPCPWYDGERRSRRAAVIAERGTGAGPGSHPGRGDPGCAFGIVAYIKEAGF